MGSSFVQFFPHSLFCHNLLTQIYLHQTANNSSSSVTIKDHATSYQQRVINMHAAPTTCLAPSTLQARCPNACNTALITLRPHTKRRVVLARADDTSPSQPTDLDAQLLQDLERLKAREASQRAQQGVAAPQVCGGYMCVLGQTCVVDHAVQPCMLYTRCKQALRMGPQLVEVSRNSWTRYGVTG